MTDFFDEGFLCTEIEKISKLCLEENADWYNLCERVNQYCVKLIPKLTFKNINRQAAFVDALFIRQVSSFESVIILTQKGITREAKILLRTLLENLFILSAITKSEEAAEAYYNLNYLTKLDGLKAQKEFNPETFTQQGLKKTQDELEEKIHNLQIKRIRIRTWAEKADLVNFYLTAYQNLSWTVHSNVLDTATLLEGVHDKDIRKVVWQPELNDIGLILMTAIECSCIGLRAVIGFYYLGLEKDIEAFQEENKSIARKPE